jgi:hypothetical protein
MTQQEARELINEVGKKIAIFISLGSIAIIVGQFGLGALDLHDHNGKPIYDAAAHGDRDAAGWLRDAANGDRFARWLLGEGAP